MTDPTGRVLPASRQPVTPEDPASPTAAPSADASGASASPDADQEIRVGGTSALNPSTSSAASAADTGETRSASLEDAQRESVRSTGRTPDYGGGATGSAAPTDDGSRYATPTYSSPTYTPPESDTLDAAGTSSPSTYADATYAAPTPRDLMATGNAAGTGGGGATVLADSGGPSAKDRATVKAKEITTRGKEAVTKLTTENELVGKAARSAQESPLVVRAKELAARRNAGGGGSHARTVEAPRPAPPERPTRTTFPRSADQIEKDIEKTRAHLAWAVDEVNYRVKPANVMARTKAKAQAQVVEPDGRVRTNRVGPAAGVAVGLLLLRVLRRRRRRNKANRRPTS